MHPADTQDYTTDLLWCYGRANAYAWQTIPAPSERRLKSVIENPDYSGLETVRMRRFKYDRAACEVEQLSLDFDSFQSGFVVDEVPQRYHRKFIRNRNITAIDKDMLKEDLLGYLLQKVADLEHRLSAIEQCATVKNCVEGH